jgi:hypothetical protein
MYFTVFSTDGKVTPLPRKPSTKKMHEILQCDSIEDSSIGIFYNGIDHHDATLLIDGVGFGKHKHVNTELNKALNASAFWRNIAIKETFDNIIIVGDAIVVTHVPLVEDHKNFQNNASSDS